MELPQGMELLLVDACGVVHLSWAGTLDDLRPLIAGAVKMLYHSPDSVHFSVHVAGQWYAVRKVGFEGDIAEQPFEPCYVSAETARKCFRGMDV